MKVAALAGVLAVAAAALVIAFQPFHHGQHVRSPREVVGAFVYQLDKGNFGKACGLLAQDYRGPLEACSQGFVFNNALNMLMFGVDAYDGATLLPGETYVGDGAYVYRIKTKALPVVNVTVKKQPNGRYRIVKIG